MGLKDALEKFNFAAQVLSGEWEKVEENSAEELSMMANVEKYPFVKCFTETAYDIQRWVNDSLDTLEQQKMIQLFNNKELYVFCIKGYDIDEENYVNEGWFYQATLHEFEDRINICEEGSGSSLVLSIESFKELFLKIPKDLYNLYLGVTDTAIIANIHHLAYQMGEKIQ